MPPLSEKNCYSDAIATKQYGAIEKDGAHETENPVEEGRVPCRIDKKPYRHFVLTGASKGRNNAMTCLGGRKLGELPQKST